jgi:uncharacterized C2H2 Zn-finger protein
MKDFYVIKCPKCGFEYLPEEVYFPDVLTGTARNIVRDELTGKIIYFDGESMNTHEEMTCDRCGCTFDVNGKINFVTKINVAHDFSEDYSTKIYKNDRIKLEEPTVNKVLW